MLTKRHDTVAKKIKILKKISKCHQNVIKMFSKCLKSSQIAYFRLEKIKISQKFSKVLKCTSKMSQKCNSILHFCDGNGSKLNVTSIYKDIQDTISSGLKKSKVLKSSQKVFKCPCQKKFICRVSFATLVLYARVCAHSRAYGCVASEHCDNNSFECGSSRHERSIWNAFVEVQKIHLSI